MLAMDNRNGVIENYGRFSDMGAKKLLSTRFY
jgi:hypothetical protein